MEKKSIFGLTSLLGFLILVYSIFIETSWLEVTHHQLNLTPNPSKKIKIVLISDLHTKGLGKLEQKVILKTKEENPDIIPRGSIEVPSVLRGNFR